VVRVLVGQADLITEGRKEVLLFYQLFLRLAAVAGHQLVFSQPAVVAAVDLTGI